MLVQTRCDLYLHNNSLPIYELVCLPHSYTYYLQVKSWPFSVCNPYDECHRIYSFFSNFHEHIIRNPFLEWECIRRCVLHLTRSLSRSSDVPLHFLPCYFEDDFIQDFYTFFTFQLSRHFVPTPRRDPAVGRCGVPSWRPHEQVREEQLP